MIHWMWEEKRGNFNFHLFLSHLFNFYFLHVYHDVHNVLVKYEYI